MNKKIGILTFHYAHNYGAVLQAYALKTKLGRMGYEAEVLNYQNKYIARLYRRGIHIDYWRRDILPNRWGRLAKLAGEQRYGKKEWLRQWQAFEQFIHTKLMDDSGAKTTSSPTLSLAQVAGSDCDTYILGSDQIWARELTHGLDPVYFGQFAPQKRRISYAASVPNGDIPEGEKPFFREYLCKLSHISVREEHLAEELRELLGRDVTTVIDPTLLLERQDYEELLRETPLESKPYVFAYYVVENPTLTQMARVAARKLGCKLVELHYQRTPDRDRELTDTRELLDVEYVYDAGPQEFLTYIRDAQMVMTNSFHGTVFSILFGRKFYSVYEENGRIENLLDFLQLGERHLAGEEDFRPEQDIDYGNTGKLLQEYRRKSEEFLDIALREKVYTRDVFGRD